MTGKSVATIRERGRPTLRVGVRRTRIETWVMGPTPREETCKRRSTFSKCTWEKKSASRRLKVVVTTLVPPSSCPFPGDPAALRRRKGSW